MKKKRFLTSRSARPWGMKAFLLLLGITLSHCGVKAAPTPLFDGPEDRFESEIQGRDNRRKPDVSPTPANTSAPQPTPPKKD